eukprot:m.387735 g.387735  ORF g.387735 m.387735 type:complete len:261 (+) comp21036_c0_seq3:1387-2169(+)
MISPDLSDPPELEFYKLTPSTLGGGSNRVVGHALLYSPAPMESLGYHYGLISNGSSCHGSGGLKRCHGPHMYLELFVGPPSGIAIATLSSWKRPFRQQRVAPRDFLLRVGPVTWSPPVPHEGGDTNAYHVWLEEGQLWGVPQHRLAGLYAPANGEFNSAVFAWPANGLTLNADVHWESDGMGSCDEKCQAYVMVEVYDASTNVVLSGYEKANCVLMNVNAVDLPLSWDPSAQPVTQGTLVFVRIYFRDATIYALNTAQVP